MYPIHAARAQQPISLMKFEVFPATLSTEAANLQFSLLLAALKNPTNFYPVCPVNEKPLHCLGEVDETGAIEWWPVSLSEADLPSAGDLVD